MQRISLRMCVRGDGRPKRKLTREEANRLQQRFNDRVLDGGLRVSAYRCAWGELNGDEHWHVGRRTWRTENDKRRDRRERKQSAPFGLAEVLHDGR